MIPTGHKAVLAALKRAKQTGALTLMNLELDRVPAELENFAELTIDGVEWWSHAQLQKLDFSNNNITQIPGQIFVKEVEIAVVRCINNKLSQLPDELFACLP